MTVEIKEKYKIKYDPNDKARWFVQLTDLAGVFAGVMYGYGAFRIKEPESPDGNLMFSFERDILYVPEGLKGKELSDDQEKEFTILLGSILYDILQDNLNKVSERGDKLVLELESNDK